MPSCNTYCLTWVSLTLDVRYLLTTTPSDLERGIAPLGPPVPLEPLLLGCGVAPLGRRPELGLGSSSRLFLHSHSLALSAAAPDLGCGVTPLGHRSSGMGSSQLLPLTLDVGLLLSATTPDLRHVVALLSCAMCAFAAAHATYIY